MYIDDGLRVVLLDFSPWRSWTDPLLFEWDELERAAAAAGVVSLPLLRLVQRGQEVRTRVDDLSRMPLEVATLQSEDVAELIRRARSADAAAAADDDDDEEEGDVGRGDR